MVTYEVRGVFLWRTRVLYHRVASKSTTTCARAKGGRLVVSCRNVIIAQFESFSDATDRVGRFETKEGLDHDVQGEFAHLPRHVDVGSVSPLASCFSVKSAITWAYSEMRMWWNWGCIRRRCRR